MKPPTATYFFLGANSESGFYSLYDEFCSDPTDTLHIIKGGPGTGKSTFMKRIGSAAEEHGLDVEYILCSGDPDSLDGVYIPALHTGWADGTAPHVLEPRQFGINAVYEDLGRFCSTAALLECRSLIATLTEEYRRSYATAYAYLHAAHSVRKASEKTLSAEMEDKLRKRARSKIKRELSLSHGSGHPTKRFVREISCKGISIAEQTINTLCSRMCVLSSNHGLEQLFFNEICRELTDVGADYYLCPDPLSPSLTECIILPAEGLCFTAAHGAPSFQGSVRTIHLDKYLSKEESYHCTVREKLYDNLLSAAMTHLRNAKHLHDDLELCYRPALDTQALNEYTEAVIHKLF